MPSLNEVLSTLSGKAEISYISVNPITRVMTVPEEYKDLGVESDKDVRRLWFKFPKIVEDDIDLSALTLYINYKNAAGNLDSYLIEDMSVEEDCIKFSWLLSRNVTKSKGTVSYIVCGKKSNNGDIVAEWNTRVSNGTVSEGLETSASIETENADVIEQILLKIGSVPSDEPNKQENQVLTAKSDGTTSYEYPTCMPISKKKGYTKISSVDIEIEIYPEDGTQAFLTDEYGKYVFSYWVTNESGSSVKKTINGALSIDPGNIVIIQYRPFLDDSEPKAEIRVSIIGASDLSNIYSRRYVSNALDEWMDNSVSVHSIYDSNDNASANSGKAICETCSGHDFGILKDALVLNLESSRGYGEALVIEGSGIGVYSYDLRNMTAEKTDKFIGYESSDVMFQIKKSGNGEYTCTPSLADVKPQAPWYVHVMYVSDDDDTVYYGNLTSADSKGIHFRILKNLTETMDITINHNDSSVTVETKALNQNSGDNA